MLRLAIGGFLVAHGLAHTSLTRDPAWSTPLTRPLGTLIRPAWRPGALFAIKAVHTVIFASIGAAIALFVWDALRQEPRRRSGYALAVVLGESAVYLSNNQVCPLTPLAEDLGAKRGAVVDMFLPAWAARRIPVVGTAATVFGAVLHVRALAKAR